MKKLPIGPFSQIRSHIMIHLKSSNDLVYFLNSFKEGISLMLFGKEFQALAPLINTLFCTVDLSVKGTLKLIERCCLVGKALLSR